MLDNPFFSDVLSEVMAGVIIFALPSILAVLVIFFRTLRTWARQNISSLLVGFLIGGVLGASAMFIVFSNPSSPQTQQTVQAPPQPSIPSIPRANHPPAQVPMQEPMSGGPPPQKKEALPSPPSPIQTRFNGVVASVVRFEKSGGLLMLQLTARNTSRQRSTGMFLSQEDHPYSRGNRRKLATQRVCWRKLHL